MGEDIRGNGSSREGDSVSLLAGRDRANRRTLGLACLAQQVGGALGLKCQDARQGCGGFAGAGGHGFTENATGSLISRFVLSV